MLRKGPTGMQMSGDDGATMLIFSGRIDGVASPGKTYKLPPFRGGASYKNLIVFVKILAKSSTDPALTVGLFHGPDGSVWTLWGDVIAQTTVTDTPPSILAGETDCDTNGHFGDWLQLAVTIEDVSEWAQIEVYVVPKVF